MPNRLHKVLDGVADRDRAFYEALRGEDDLGMVVRAHIHIEHELREFIRAAAPAPDQFKPSDLDFGGTVRLALILGLDAEFKTPLLHLGSLRNKFAHRLDMRISEEEAKNFWEALGPAAKRAAVGSFESLKVENPDYRMSSLQDFVARDRLMICVISLRGGILLEQVRALGKLKEL